MLNQIDDAYLYLHLPYCEEVKLSQLPNENQLSHAFSNRFNRKMKALIKYERRTPFMNVVIHRFKIAMVTLLIFISLALGTIISVEAYRLKFFELLREVWHDFTSIHINVDEIESIGTLIPEEPTYIPEGYSILESQRDEYTQTIIYTDSNGIEINYNQHVISQSVYLFDTENAETETKAINGQTINIISNKNTIQVYWFDDVHFFAIVGIIDKNEIIKMAESIILK